MQLVLALLEFWGLTPDTAAQTACRPGCLPPRLPAAQAACRLTACRLTACRPGCLPPTLPVAWLPAAQVPVASLLASGRQAVLRRLRFSVGPAVLPWRLSWRDSRQTNIAAYHLHCMSTVSVALCDGFTLVFYIFLYILNLSLSFFLYVSIYVLYLFCIFYIFYMFSIVFYSFSIFFL